ncbi:MAG: dihydroneopterin aldolase [Opitutaceae bacterium]|nr:dihydroneopterin aldolase [Cytophagales bacterium]
MEKFKISLEGIELYGRHGLYPGEKELGARYRIEVSFEVKLPDKKLYELEDLVDYKKAYDIVVEAFQQPTTLLENLCRTIAARLKIAFSNAHSVNIAISKLSPPLGGICQAAKVEYTLT